MCSTAALGCRLVLTAGIVTSQTLPPAGQTEEEVTIQAVQQEKDGSIYHLRGEEEIHYRTYTLYADQITYNADTGDSELESHGALDGGPYDEHVEASHGTYKSRTEAGTFYSVIRTVVLRLRHS